MPGIDALRAIAVLAVFFYHAGVGWMPGGFLGVDVFFVISGYLITSLLLSEYRRGGHIQLGKFWARRAQRLLPAVGVFIALTMLVGAIAEPDRITELRGDAVASLFYFANWHFIFGHQSYFEQFQTPSLFRHLWSLSVEEQFYLFWPLCFAAGMSAFGRRRLILGVIAGALGSVALAWVLFAPGAEASRVYYGTDTHAVGLLAGVALALAWSPWGLRRGSAGRWSGPLLDGAGVIALGYIVLSFLQVHDYDLSLYHGGYLVLAIASTVLIAVLAHPAARLGSLLARSPMLWLGLRSYSFYLWHWPVLVISAVIGITAPKAVKIPLQLALVLVLADLSYRFVELPFRGKTKLAGLPQNWLRFGRPALAIAVLCVVFAIGWSGIVKGGGTPSKAGLTAASTAEFAEVSAKHTPPGAPAQKSTSGAALRSPERALRIFALGDSVMVGAKEELLARLGPGFSMNAKEGRQLDEVIALARQLKSEAKRPEDLIIQVGNNGPLYSEEMEALRSATSEAGHTFLVNDHAPVSWVGESNEMLAQAAMQWPHTSLIDWSKAAKAHAGVFWDGIHLTPAGAKLYARTIAAAVGAQERAGAARPRR